MEFKYNINEYGKIEGSFTDFISNIGILKEALKYEEKYKNLYEYFSSLKKKEIFLYFILFHNFEKWINVNFEKNINTGKMNESEILLKYIKTNKEKNYNIHLIYIYWIVYLYIELVKNFNEFLKLDLCQINKIKYAFRQTSRIILYLFKHDVFNESQMYDFIFLIYFFIERNFLLKIFSDKIQKTKKYFLFKEFFYLLLELFVELNNKYPNNINDNDKLKALSKYFNFLKEIKNNKKMNSRLNKSLLINNEIILYFMKNIFEHINGKILEQFDSNYSKNLSEFFEEYIKHNYKKSKIFDLIIYSLRKSFINLYNFEKNKDKITQDLFINSFYSIFLRNIFLKKNILEENEALPKFDCFYFNGYDSQISLNIQNNIFEKSSLFFSFNLSETKERKNYPLFLIEKNFDKKKEVLLNIYLQKDEKDDFFYLWEKQGDNGNKLSYKIQFNTTYYLCVCFNDNQLLIKIYNEKENNIQSLSFEKYRKLLSKKITSISFSFGFYKKKEEVFSGYIGPIMILSNPKQSKVIEDFITSVLKLGKNYIKYIPLCLNLDFIEEDELIFQNKKKSELKYKLDNIECLLYLIPQNFISFNEQSGVVNKLPIDDNYCSIQENYNIQIFKVSIAKYENGFQEFIKDNGLDYICLLYEYIYQLSANLFNIEIKTEDNKKFLNTFLKYIIIIFKETMSILEKIYNEVQIENFFKSLKQIYMKFFSCLNLISEHSKIIDVLINPIFAIIEHYYYYFCHKEKFILINDEEKNNYIFKTNLSFMNGFIDSLLNPDIYNFERRDTLISLFNHLSKYLSYINDNESEDKINQIIYIKLSNFIDYIYNEVDFTQNNNINYKDAITELQNSIYYNDEDNILLNSFLNSLNSIYKYNPSKKENMNNLKNMFKNIIENLNEDDKSLYIISKFINNCINNNVDKYFSDDDNENQISALITITNRLISKKIKINQESKDDKGAINKIQNFDNLIDGIISFLFKILFTKEKILDYAKIIKNFIVKNIEISNDLLKSIFKELRIILLKYILTNTNIKEEKVIINKKLLEEKKYSSEELKTTANFYSEIFNIIIFILEEIKINANNKVNEEKEILELFEHITKIVKNQIDNHNSKNNNDNNSEFNKLNKINYLDIIYFLINFLKFYHHILFKKLYQERFIKNFIELCYICKSSGLIYSSYLITIDEKSNIRKTILEMILDIIFFYMNLSTNKYIEDSLEDNIDKDNIINSQKIIYDFFQNLFPPEEKGFKDIRKKYTIFYINDYLRYLLSTYPKDRKKKPKKDEIYSEYSTELDNLQEINKLLLKGNQFCLNFSTFFIIKCNGYKHLIFELMAKIPIEKEKEKSYLKLDDTLTMIIYVISQIYNEQKLLYSKETKSFFFPKVLNTFYKDYIEIKKDIEIFLRNGIISNDIDQYILTKIYNEKDFKNVFSLINSGLCLSKKEEIKEQFKSTKTQKYNYSDNFQNNNSSSVNNFSKTFTYDDSTQKKLLIETASEDPEFDDKNDFELTISEMSFSQNNKNNIIEDNSTNEFTGSPSANEINNFKKKKLSNHSTNTFYNKRILSQSFISTNSNDSNSINNISYLNYFFQPDEFLLRNSKKQLMMSIFSVYFFDHFFNCNSFKLMKNHYLKNFDGIQKTTKLLNYPSKVKIFNNGLEPYLFLKPNSSFFESETFHITHDYFMEYMKEMKINLPEKIFFHKNILPNYYLKDKFDKKCELIRIDRCYYGHIIGSEKIDYIIFEKQKFVFNETIDEYKKLNNSNIILNNFEIMNLFSLTYANKKTSNKKEETQSNFGKRKKIKKNKVVIILFDEIEEIIERRFLLMWQAIEIFLKNGKSYFFNFLSKKQNEFILNIFEKNEKTKNKILRKNQFSKIVKSLVSEWQQEQITTYEYLLFLNKYSTRTYNEVNQYPIFPWLIRKFAINEDQKGQRETSSELRDFRYPMAAQNEESRQSALNRFKDDEDIGEIFPIHYGTHYSTSSYVYFYLMREEPFTTLLIKLQGNKQENPDRMFYSYIDTLFILESGHDNRECIPDILCKIEQYINLNCVNFGKKSSGIRVDDFNIYAYNEYNEVDKRILLNHNNYSIDEYVKFILNENRLLNSKKIAYKITKWFDIIFGVGQLPEKNMKNCLNIFNMESYEQKINLYEILQESKENKLDFKTILFKLENKIDLMTSFGQTPFQILNEKHPTFYEQKKAKENNKEKDYEEGDFENILNDLVWPKFFKKNIEIQPLFFEIYPSLGKIFLIDSKRQLEILDTNFYNSEAIKFEDGIFDKLQLPKIKILEKSKVKNTQYYIIKHKYCISVLHGTINMKEQPSFKPDNSFNLYYNNYLKNLSNEKLRIKKKNKKEELFFITCRYSDNSFKIHYISNKKTKKEKNDKYCLSIICEDFVCSVCALDHNKLLVGLKNGKLIQYSLNKESIKNEKIQIRVNFNKKIQAHKKAINVIEVNFRLGMIITAGEDNYLFLRKIYDFELLTPIKFKSKYIITTAKISPLNFLYVQCFNLKKKSSIIFGYTLNGIFFAKSKYAYFESLDFTRSGNIVTFVRKYENISLKSENTSENKSETNSEKKSDNNSIKSENTLVPKNEIKILKGADLKEITIHITDEKTKIEWEIIKKKLYGSSWANFHYITRKDDSEQNIFKCITFIPFNKNNKGGNNRIDSDNVSDIRMFD